MNTPQMTWNRVEVRNPAVRRQHCRELSLKSCRERAVRASQQGRGPPVVGAANTAESVDRDDHLYARKECAQLGGVLRVVVVRRHMPREIVGCTTA